MTHPISTIVVRLQLFEIFHNFLSKEPDVRCAALSDLAACRERDPACSSYRCVRAHVLFMGLGAGEGASGNREDCRAPGADFQPAAECWEVHIARNTL